MVLWCFCGRCGHFGATVVIVVPLWSYCRATVVSLVFTVVVMWSLWCHCGCCGATVLRCHCGATVVVLWSLVGGTVVILVTLMTLWWYSGHCGSTTRAHVELCSMHSSLCRVVPDHARPHFRAVFNETKMMGVLRRIGDNPNAFRSHF